MKHPVWNPSMWDVLKGLRSYESGWHYGLSTWTFTIGYSCWILPQHISCFNQDGDLFPSLKILNEKYDTWTEKHWLADGRLVISTVAVAFAGFALIYDYLEPFPKSKAVSQFVSFIADLLSSLPSSLWFLWPVTEFWYDCQCFFSWHIAALLGLFLVIVVGLYSTLNLRKVQNKG